MIDPVRAAYGDLPGWRDLTFIQRVNRRVVGLTVLTAVMLSVLFLPFILAVVGEFFFGSAGAFLGALIGVLGWAYAAAAFYGWLS